MARSLYRDDGVVTLRCTKKLLRRLRATTPAEARPPSTALGDWYATILHTHPRHLIICVSERALLSVILPARELNTLTSRFHAAVKEHLLAIGASPQAVAREMAGMQEIELGSTMSKSVLGSLRELTFAVEFELPRGRFSTLEELQLYLSTYIMGAIGMRYPREAALELLRDPQRMDQKGRG